MSFDNAVKKAFVLMPFKKPFDSYFELIYKPALKESGFQVTKADDLLGSRIIMMDILNSIKEADLILCDMTSRNPNVFYELGLAHSIGKPVILLSKNESDIPFDLHHIRTIIYNTENAGWEDKLSNQIKNYSSEENYSGFIYSDAVVSNFLKQRFDTTEIINLIESSREVVFFGAGYTIFLPILHDYYSKKSIKTKIKFILIDPEGDAVRMASIRANIKADDPIQKLRKIYRTNSNKVMDLVKNSNGLIDYFVIDYLPPYNIIGFDINSPNGILHIRLAAWEARTIDRPFFELYNNKDRYWFNFFVKELEKIEKASKIANSCS
ncbi:MAG: hypothetical protein U9R53_08800 [Chloroflexota bacterium]|nr:hypothetical protein [Chloroflexota bacterium]